MNVYLKSEIGGVLVTKTLERLEAEIRQLTLNEQLWLLRQLTTYIYADIVQPRMTMSDEQLFALAHDPEIQREIRDIEDEFAVTELDGLMD